MEGVAAFLVWFSVTIWAAWFVSRRVADGRTRILWYLLVWLFPIVGAAAAVLIIGFGSEVKTVDSEGRMFDAVVDAHRKRDD